MVHPNTFRTCARVMKIFLMVLLIGFEFVPGLAGGDAHYINQAALQLPRSQLLVNTAYTLIYRSAAEQAQALRDMQQVLPAFEREQTVLLTNPLTDVQNLLHQINGDYLSLVTAAHAIIAHPQAVTTPLQVNIIVAHAYNYLVTMNNLVSILSSHFQDRNMQLFIIQICSEILFLVLCVMVIVTLAKDVYVHVREKRPPVPSRTVLLFFGRRALVFLMVFVLMGLEILPLLSGKDAADLYQATLQRTRCEVLAKSAFVLAYRSAANKALAFSDVQVVLPLFQQEQTTLLTNTQTEVQQQVQQAKPEYLTMFAAGHALIVSPVETVNPVNPAVNAMIAHRKSCFSAMNGIVLALQNTMEQRATHIFAAEVAIEVTLIFFLASLLAFSREPLRPQERLKQE